MDPFWESINCFLYMQICILLWDMDEYQHFCSWREVAVKITIRTECFAVMNVNLYWFVSEENVQNIVGPSKSYFQGDQA